MASKKQTGMDLGKVLLWSAVLVEAPRWAGAMLAADVSAIPEWLSLTLNIMNTVSGVFMGVVVVVATAYLLDALRQTKPTLAVRRKGETVEVPNWRFRGLMVFVIGLLALTPLVLGPYIVSRMTGDSIATVLSVRFWQYSWAITVVVAPVFVVGGVAFAQPGLVKLTENEPQVAVQVSETKPKVSKEKPEHPVTYGKWKTWRKVPIEEQMKIVRMTMEQVMETYGVEERTAYNWLEYARRDHGVLGEVAKFQDEVMSEV
jgi:MFS family permease